jgi:hypothetical protein
MNIKQANLKSKNAGHAVRGAVIEGAFVATKALASAVDVAANTGVLAVNTAWLLGSSLVSFGKGVFTEQKPKRVVRSAKH